MLDYSDMGSMPNCNSYASENGGSFVQVSLNITNFPINIPASFCLPKQCNDSALFKGFQDKIESMANTLLLILRSKLNLDELYE